MKRSQFRKKLAAAVNAFGREDMSGTPDFILAQYLDGCLVAFDIAVQQRETWHGRDDKPLEETGT